MSEKKSKQTLPVTEAGQIAEGIYSLTVQYPEVSAPEEVKPGQFVGVYPKNAASLLPRPISICEWNKEERTLRLVYRTVGKGTKEFSRLQTGDTVDLLGILGNGYEISSLKGKKVLLLGGGIGAPPMLGLAEALYEANKEAGEDPGNLVTAVMGYRTDDLFLAEEFGRVSRLLVSTDDGTAGVKGNVVDAVRTLLEKVKETHFDAVCACGPMPMLKALCAKTDKPGQISLEARMGCGFGACMGCTIDTVNGPKRVCREGPVFGREEIKW